MLLGVVALVACDGTNLFTGPPPTTGRDDTEGPAVQILSPSGDSVSAKPIGDSVLVTVRVQDKVGVDSVAFTGVAFRGDPDLGTDTVVTRFEEKRVRFVASTEDTTVSRFLIPTADSIKETAQIIATAWDSAGNPSADTVPLILGGPDVQILNLVGGEFIQAGRELSVRVQAQDPQGITSVTLIATGAVTATVVKPINPPADSVTVDTTLTIPNGSVGELQLLARAANSLDVRGQVGPLTLTVVP
ncbi:MAG: hypothetical protein D6701_09075, partial [Gemmatimonadetes bacterium]